MDYSKLPHLIQRVLNLSLDPMQRSSYRYIENMVHIVREIRDLQDHELETVSLSQIATGSGHQAELRIRNFDFAVPIDVMFLIELPQWLRVKSLEAYNALLRSQTDQNTRISMDHQRLFSELKMVVTTQSYNGIFHTKVNTLFDYCIKEMKQQARMIAARKGINRNQAEVAATKLNQLNHILKYPRRALFRLVYLEAEIKAGNPELEQKLKEDYYSGSRDALLYYMKVTKEGIGKETARVEEKMSELAQIELKTTSGLHFPGSFILGEVEDENLDKLRDIAKRWDQLAFKAMPAIRESFGHERFGDYLTKLKKLRTGNQLNAQDYLGRLVDLFTTVRSRIRDSTDPGSWVHSSLDWEFRLNKINDSELETHHSWVWSNAGALSHLMNEILDELESASKHAHMPPILEKVVRAYQQGRVQNYNEKVYQEDSEVFSSAAQVQIQDDLMDIVDSDGEPSYFSELLKLHRDTTRRLEKLNIQDTLFYGKIKAAFPDPRMREEKMVNLYKKIRQFKETQTTISKKITTAYLVLPNLTELEPDLLEHLVVTMERSSVDAVMNGAYQHLQCSYFEVLFKRIKVACRGENQLCHLRLLKRVLRSIPPVDKIKAFESSRFTAGSLGFPLDMEDNDARLQVLKEQIDLLLADEASDLESLFTAIGMADYWWGNVEHDLDLLKADFVDIAALNPDDPLIKSFQILKERIEKGRLRCMKGVDREVLYRDNQQRLDELNINSDQFKLILEDNKDRLNHLMLEANNALKNLKLFHQKLGGNDQLDYLDIVLNPDETQQARDQYNLIPETTYEVLQRFAAVVENRNRMLNTLIDDIHLQKGEIDPMLTKTVTKAVCERFKMKRSLPAEAKLEILYRQVEMREIENRYFCYLANYSINDHFMSNIAVKRTKQLFGLIDSGLTQVRKLRLIYGNLRSEMYQNYEPEEWEGLLAKNRALLFNEIKSVTSGRLDLL